VSKYSDIFWDKAETAIPTWDEKERAKLRKSFKEEIENCADKDKQAERVEVYEWLEGQYIGSEGRTRDLHPEWIYGRIASYLRIAPFIKKEIYEKNRSLLKEVSRFFRNWEKRLKRRKGKRKPRVEYSAEDFPRSTVDPIEPGLIEYKFMPEIEEEAEIKAPGIVITFDDEGNPTSRVPGYGPGVPPERYKLENELISDLFHFLITREKNELIVYGLLEDIFEAFLGESLTTTAIAARIRRHPN